MGVYIDMEMPKSCANCNWSKYSFPDAWCSMMRHKVDIEVAKNGRPNDCPLIEIPEQHGRLIDADALKEVIASAKYMDADIYDGRLLYSDHLCAGADYDDICEAIDETPTVIPASEGAEL